MIAILIIVVGHASHSVALLITCCELHQRSIHTGLCSVWQHSAGLRAQDCMVERHLVGGRVGRAAMCTVNSGRCPQYWRHAWKVLHSPCLQRVRSLLANLLVGMLCGNLWLQCILNAASVHMQGDMRAVTEGEDVHNEGDKGNEGPHVACQRVSAVRRRKADCLADIAAARSHSAAVV